MVKSHVYPSMTQLLLFLFLSPLIVFVIQLIFGTKLPRKGDFIALLVAVICCVSSSILFVVVWNQSPVTYQWNWFIVGKTIFHIRFLLNNLSVIMLLLVSFISLLVHVYSLFYMRNEVFYHRYWAYLGLFTFAMIGVILSDNLLILYFFWELVGFSSYLLIGFWFKKSSAIQANKKAFLVNRFGDMGFLIAIGILYAHFHQLTITELFAENTLSKYFQQDAFWVHLVGISFFIAAMAKSAQFPFHVWLLDAMEGPTSVSALIHAATMVAAGVFLLIRVNPIFTPSVLLIIAIVGTFTALFAALLACVQTDLKKILAFSTISQLGFMICAIGIGSCSSALFHLVTHAFFKCLLFLCAGIVIYYYKSLFQQQNVNLDAQDIRNMGNLRKTLPLVFITMLIASAALIGFPFTSGALSKENILIHLWYWAVQKEGWYYMFPIILLLATATTIIYTTRFIYKIFIARPTIELLCKDKLVNSLHPLPFSVKIPLFLLSLCCFFVLFAWSPFSLAHSWLLNGFLTGIVYHSGILTTFINVFIISILLISILFYRFSITFSHRFYIFNMQVPQYHAFLNHCRNHITYVPIGGFIRLLNIHRRRTDIVIANIFLMISNLANWVDRKIMDQVAYCSSYIALKISLICSNFDIYGIDGIIHGITTGIRNFSIVLRLFQRGNVQKYLSVFFVTLLLLLLLFYLF